ncbi:MAG TPA: RnfH family protein [Burkholderiales bacterium]|nr:RnfH family protein [Burkholderiales bacterium]
MIRVEVLYAEAASQARYVLRLPQGSTVEEAIRASGVLQAFPNLDLETNRVGIFAKLVMLDTVLQEGDRVEIYRPLIIDPKEARRARGGSGFKRKQGQILK